jgi:predicted site-specific integrase-resolvase
MDPREAEEYLRLNERTITRWARKRYIPAHPLGEGKRKFWRTQALNYRPGELMESAFDPG